MERPHGRLFNFSSKRINNGDFDFNERKKYLAG